MSASLTSTSANPPSSASNNRYSSEITQMLYVLGRATNVEQKDIDDEVLCYIEQVVRNQLVEIVTSTRFLSHARSIATSSSNRNITLEDLLFVLRNDKDKMNRLTTYLGWKDVRKKFKETGDDEEGDVVDEGAVFADRSAERGSKALSKKIKLPWQLSTMYGDVLPEEYDDDQDRMQISKHMKKNLQEADEITRDMTKEDYAYYTECRNASFVYKKAKKFREFLNLGIVIESTLTDDVLDVLGFLAFEMIRSISDAGIHERRLVALSKAESAVKLLKEEREEERRDQEREREREEEERIERRKAKTGTRRSTRGSKRESTVEVEENEATKTAGTMDPPPSPSKRLKKGEPALVSAVGKEVEQKDGASITTTASAGQQRSRSPPRPLVTPTGLFSAPPEPKTASMVTTPGGTHRLGAEQIVEGLVAEVAARERQPLAWADIHNGIGAVQRGRNSLKASGMRNWRAGAQRVPSRFT